MFDYVSIEHSLMCPYDSLQFRDGPYISSPALTARLCKVPSEIFTTGNQSYVVFFSDYFYGDIGAKVYYQGISGIF